MNTNGEVYPFTEQKTPSNSLVKNMPKSLFIFSYFIVILSHCAIGQQRIGVDVSSQMTNLMFTGHYQKVLKNQFLYSVGIFGGSNGRAFIHYDTILLYSNYPPQSPYSTINQGYSDSTGNQFSIFDYTTAGSSVGIQAGFGYFHEFDVQHGLRFNFNTSIGYAHARVSGNYRSTENFSTVFDVRHTNHWFGSVSFEAYHTIRLTGRITFNYGVKVPFHFSVDKAKFNPVTYKDLFYGFEPHLSMGMTRVIGKCD